MRSRRADRSAAKGQEPAVIRSITNAARGARPAAEVNVALYQMRNVSLEGAAPWIGFASINVFCQGRSVREPVLARPRKFAATLAAGTTSIALTPAEAFAVPTSPASAVGNAALTAIAAVTQTTARAVPRKLEPVLWKAAVRQI